MLKCPPNMPLFVQNIKDEMKNIGWFLWHLEIQVERCNFQSEHSRLVLLSVRHAAWNDKEFPLRLRFKQNRGVFWDKDPVFTLQSVPAGAPPLETRCPTGATTRVQTDGGLIMVTPELKRENMRHSHAFSDSKSLNIFPAFPKEDLCLRSSPEQEFVTFKY